MSLCKFFCRNLNRLLGARQLVTHAGLKSASTANCLPNICLSAAASINNGHMIGDNTLIRNHIIPLRLPVNRVSVELPKRSNTLVPNVIESPFLPQGVDEIHAPALENSDACKEAARLIVIRRKKMKKHKLRKLRKKMKYVWAKVRQKRELKKEKTFQSELIEQYKSMDSFSAEDYVKNRLTKYNEMNSIVSADM